MSRAAPSGESASSVVFHGQAISIGRFRAPPNHSRWSEENWINGHCIVFPRAPVGIRTASDRPVIADPTIVMLYNHGDRYHADCLTDRGDECEWFGIDASVLRDAMRSLDPGVDERGDKILPFGHGRCLGPWYARQRALYEVCRSAVALDALWVEESVLNLLDSVLSSVIESRNAAAPGVRRARTPSRDLARAAQLWLARNYRRLPSLTSVSEALDTSVFHLCREFRAATGMTIHQYLIRLRLTAALEALAAGDTIVDVALRSGFCSQAHFTAAFQRLFGVPPAHWRRALQRPGAIGLRVDRARTKKARS